MWQTICKKLMIKSSLILSLAFLFLLFFDALLYGEQNKIIPEASDAHSDRCREHYGKGDFVKAIDDCTKAIEINPQSAWAYYNRGNAWLAQGDTDRAIEDYFKAIRLDSNYAIAYNSRGVAFYSKGKYEQSVKDFLKALEINPNYDQAINNIAWLYATCPDTKILNGKKAITLAQRAIDLGNMNDTFLAIVYYKTLAAAYAQVGNFKKAIKTEEDVGVWLKYDGYTDMLTESKERLKIYKSYQPWRTKGKFIIKDMSSAGLIIYRDPII
jgi:tetratricopeptide (TPR) repeat protein